MPGSRVPEIRLTGKEKGRIVKKNQLCSGEELDSDIGRFDAPF
ncbi:hypothetical protein [Marinobacter halodurans]|nr:hypothetical protein [Marinobacter halodurans]